MQILESNENGVAVLAVEGRMDTNTSPEAEKAITRQIEGGAQRILLDLAGLEYMSSAGLRVLLLGVKKTRAAGATLSLSGVRKEIQEILVMSGFASFFPSYPTKDDALAAGG